MQDLAKPIAGILTSRKDRLDEVIFALADYFGPADIVGEWREFNHTNYYEDEMGKNLFRVFVSFEKLVAPEIAVKFKGFAKKVEESFRENGARVVNIDPGYLDANKVILITGKHGGHKIALETGVWADFLLWYNKGWVALPWAFPDFRDGGLFPLFAKMRARFKTQARISQPVIL